MSPDKKTMLTMGGVGNEVFSVPAGWCGRLEKRIWTNGEQA